MHAKVNQFERIERERVLSVVTGAVITGDRSFVRVEIRVSIREFFLTARTMRDHGCESHVIEKCNSEYIVQNGFFCFF